MNRRLLAPVALTLSSASLFLAFGCGRGQSAPDNGRQAVTGKTSQASASAAAAPAYPTLPRPAEVHPAPSDTPNLDRAETAAAENPRDYRANLQAALAYYKIKAYAQAADAFEKAIALKPDDPTPYLYRGWTQMALGSLPDAVATFQKAADLPGATRDQQSDAFLGLGDCYLAMKLDDKAKEAFSRSIGTNPKQGMASLALGTFAAMRGQAGQAHDFFHDAATDLKTPKEKARAYAALGRLAEEGKDRKAAAENYRKALALDPKNVWAKRQLPVVTAAAK
jgi:tetratricopeptide (TPR) repeat protein